MDQVLKDLAQVNPWACALAIAAIAVGMAFVVKYVCKVFITLIRGD